MTVTAATSYRIRLISPVSLAALTIGNDGEGFQFSKRFFLRMREGARSLAERRRKLQVQKTLFIHMRERSIQHSDIRKNFVNCSFGTAFPPTPAE